MSKRYYKPRYFHKKKKEQSIEKEILENRINKEYEDIQVIKTDLNNKKSFSKRFENLKIKYKKDPKKFIILATSFMLVICLLTGTSYAALSYLSKTNSTARITAGTLALELKNESNTITLENAIPQEDKDAIKNNKIYEFTVENNGTIPAHYIVSIENTCDLTKYYQTENEEVKPDKCIPSEYIKIGISQNEGEYKVLEYNQEENNYILETGILEAQETKDYQMKIWLDYNTPNDYNSEGIYNIVYSGKIGIDYKQVNVDLSDNIYTVSYNANGGIGEMASTLFTVDEEKALSKNTFTKDGYFFLGWDTNATGKTVVYEDEEIVKSLTDEDNKIVNLYAVWGEPGTYQIRYNGNGGTIKNYTTTEEYPWVLEDGVYKSGNVDVHDTSSIITSGEFTLTETTTISFDWAASSESKSYDYLYYTIYKEGEVLTGTGTSTKIGGNSWMTDEAELTYTTVTKQLEPGTYKIEFTYRKDVSDTSGLDRGYVKNISYFGKEKMENSTHTIGDISALSQNEYKKEGYNFLGWSTTENGKLKYTEASQVKNLSSEKDEIIDLYAVWTKKEYEIEVTVHNGTLNDDSLKIVKYQEEGTFNIIPNEENIIGVVECTNGQIGVYKNNILTIKNVTDSTTCTVKLVDEVTTLYEDGTLAINEDYIARDVNIETHGNVLKTYESLSATQSYVFSSYEEQLWTNEYSDITKVEVSKEIRPTSTANWFSYLENLSEGDFTKLDTSQTTDMSYMFNNASANLYQLKLIGLSNWNTSNVTDMSYLFNGVGYTQPGPESVDVGANVESEITLQSENINIFEIGDLSEWDTSNVTDMSYMFCETGYGESELILTGLSNWDTSNVTNMEAMFLGYAGSYSGIEIENLSDWDTSQVTNMNSMFERSKINIDALENWDISNVKYMGAMFYSTILVSSDGNIDLTSWNTENIESMESMFEYANITSKDLNLNISNWNVEKVTTIDRMFSSAFRFVEDISINMKNWDLKSLASQWYTFGECGTEAKNFSLNVTDMQMTNLTDLSSFFSDASSNVYGVSSDTEKAEKFEIIGLNTWDTSNVTDMSYMFANTGAAFEEWTIGDISNWNTSKVESMWGMFESSATTSTTNIDFKPNWDTSKVKDMRIMFSGFGLKAQNLNIDLSSFDTSNVTKITGLFEVAGKHSEKVTIKLGDWDLSNATSTNYMFEGTGYNANEFIITGLNNWNTSNITTMQGTFNGTGANAKVWSIGNLSNWNFEKVKYMNSFMNEVGINATDFQSVGTINIPTGCSVGLLAANSPHFKGNFIINGSLSNYQTMLTNSATGENANINLSYTTSTGETYTNYLIDNFGPNGTVSQGKVYKVAS